MTARFEFLFNQGQLENPNLLYCPAITGGQLSKAAFPDPYGERYNSNEYPLPNSGIVKCSYPFNPHVYHQTDARPFIYTKLENVPTGALMAGDPFYNIFYGDSDHKTSGEKSPTWNRTFMDGHVSIRTSSALYTHLEQSDCGNNWDDFDKALDYLQ